MAWPQTGFEEMGKSAAFLGIMLLTGRNFWTFSENWQSLPLLLSRALKRFGSAETKRGRN
jgi:hypothetical protein